VDAGVAAIIVLAYVSLLVELTILHVPSVASSKRIWIGDTEIAASYSGEYRRLFGFRKSAKFAFFIVPVLISCATFAYPLLTIALGADPLGDYMLAPTHGSNAAAALLVILGRVCTLASVVTIRRDNRQVGDSFELHRAGLFRWSRNPGLVGMYAFVFGLWLAAPSASMLAGIVVYVASMDFKVRMEEDFLESRFGRAYLDYRARTGRYMP
jgi:protein-S-isoprenylcysteine O-methyltransferase Ste14